MSVRTAPASWLALTMAASLAGCGSTPEQPDETVATDRESNYFHGGERLYAHLTTGSGGSWVLTTVTDSAVPPADGFLVRLNDLAPAFDTRTAECEPQAYPANHRCNPAQPFRDREVGVVGKLISGGIAAGTAGKVTDISRTYATSFDETAFNKAVDEALTNTGFGSQRIAFIDLYERYTAAAAGARGEFAELARDAVARYEDTSALPISFATTVDGIAQYYGDDLELPQLVTLTPDSRQRPAGDAPEFGKLLPCPARECLHRARTQMQALSTELERRRAGTEAMDARQDLRYDVSCDTTRAQGYTLRLTCPDSVTRADLLAGPVPVTVTVLARDFDGLYPTLELSDDTLDIVIDGDTVRLTNRTGGYVSVDAETVYYNDQIATSSSNLDVAPGVTIERPIDSLVTPAVRIEARYGDMTPAKAARIGLTFGYAARYRVSGSGDERTLFDRRSYTAGCVIGDRLAPGSCDARGRSERPHPGMESPGLLR